MQLAIDYLGAAYGQQVIDAAGRSSNKRMALGVAGKEYARKRNLYSQGDRLFQNIKQKY